VEGGEISISFYKKKLTKQFFHHASWKKPNISERISIFSFFEGKGKPTRISRSNRKNRKKRPAGDFVFLSLQKKIIFKGYTTSGRPRILQMISLQTWKRMFV
jgi:hypothetical protein